MVVRKMIGSQFTVSGLEVLILIIKNRISLSVSKYYKIIYCNLLLHK